MIVANFATKRRLCGGGWSGAGDVAHEAVVFGTFDGGMAEELAVGVGGEVLPVGGLHGEELGGRGEFGDGGGTGAAVVGTGLLAAVAAVDGGAEGGVQVWGDVAAVFDGEVGEAATCVEVVGTAEGAGGAGAEAVVAGAAAGWEGCVVVVGGEGGDDFAEEEVTAGVGDDEVGVLACPAESGSPCPVAFEEGFCVAADEVGGCAGSGVG